MNPETCLLCTSGHGTGGMVAPFAFQDQEQLWEQAWQGLQVSAIEIAAAAALSAFLWQSAGAEQI